MEAKEEEEVQVVVVKEPTNPCLFDGDSGFLFLDHTICSFTAFYPKNDNTHPHNPKLLGVVDSKLSSEDSDSVDDGFSDDDDDEGCVDVDDMLYDEKVKKKLQVLAAMVGIAHSSSPGVVLTEVVRVMKELERDRREIADMEMESQN